MTRQPIKDMQLEETITLDKKTPGWRITQDGYLVASPRVARTGIQTYHPVEMGIAEDEYPDGVRVYRPVDEVFHKVTLTSMAHRPITLDHVTMVNAQNWKDVAVGQTGDEVARDGEFIRVPIMLMDAEAIAAVNNGKAELSVGYYADLDWETGKTEDGEEYHAIQRNIRANHLAIVSKARGGPKLRIGDNRKQEDPPMTVKRMFDGIEIEFGTEQGAQIIQRLIEKLTGQVGDEQKKYKDAETAHGSAIGTVTAERDTLKKDVEKKDGEIVALKKQLEDAKISPEKLDAMARDRMVLLRKALYVLGDDFKADGKTDLELRRAVVAKKLGDDGAKAMTDAAVEGAFSALTADIDLSKTSVGLQDLSRSLSQSGGNNMHSDAADKAWRDRQEQIRNAWKNPTAKSA